MSNSLPVQHFVPEQTIQSYLDALLQDAAAELALSDAQVDLKPEPKASPAQLEVVAPPTPETSVNMAPPPVETPPAPQPSWRNEPFEALLFDVGGLTLAVPLVSLGTIHALNGPITPLFGQPDWFLGLLPTEGGNLKVLDTARWVMPERYHPTLREGLRFVISVQGYEWGMAVHGVSESIRLNPEQIKWRSGQGKRPWLAGTVIEHMCALLDVEALAELISRGR
ncbi:MAG: CheW domain-containing protein [Pseudomonas sp.]